MWFIQSYYNFTKYGSYKRIKFGVVARLHGNLYQGSPAQVPTEVQKIQYYLGL